MDQGIADLLGLDLNDPAVVREHAAVKRDMELIDRLVEERHRRGLTQREVAERMGCSQPAVSDFERLGGDPHLSSIRRYALAVGVAIAHTVSEEHVPDPAGPAVPADQHAWHAVAYRSTGSAPEDRDDSVEHGATRRWDSRGLVTT